MTDLSKLISQHLSEAGSIDTPLDGIQLFRIEAPIRRISGVYPPSLCIIVQGTKRAYLDGRAYVYEAGQYLCATMPIPVEAEVPEATSEAPLLGVMVSLETQVAAETIVACQATRSSSDPSPSTPSGLSVALWDDAFAVALYRVLDLLDDWEAVRILGPGRVRELIFAAIQGEGGTVIRRHLGSGQEIARIVGYVRDHLHEPISVDDLARRAGMSRAVFDRRFKAATTYAPLQFIKAMRLNNAALMLRQGATVSEAAYTVGYASASQFSREFRRQFDMPPRTWGRAYEAEGLRPTSVPFTSAL